MPAEDLAQAKRILDGQVSVAEILAYLQSDRFMSKRSAQHYCDLGEKKIEEFIRTGKLRAFNCGKKILIRKSDLDALILGHEITRETHEADKSDLQRLTDRALEQAKANIAAKKEKYDCHSCGRCGKADA
jgi:hypothetical protein